MVMVQAVRRRLVKPVQIHILLPILLLQLQLILILPTQVYGRKSIPYSKQSYLYPTKTQWNPSPNIDDEGFLKQSYRRIVGNWETDANIGGRYG